MDNKQASLLQLTADGWSSALAAESKGFYARITGFSVASLSMPTFVDSRQWGTEVWKGEINDFEILDQNTILYTLIIPPQVPATTIDSVALYLSDGTLFAQGMLRTPRSKLDSSSCYIYAYVNAPEPAIEVEARLKTQATFPQVEDYSELPAAGSTFKHEYLVNNGHCGYFGENVPSRFLPTLVVANRNPSNPNVPSFQPDQPFLRPDLGTLVQGTYRYGVSALTSVGETRISKLSTVVLQQLTVPVATIQADSGALSTGTYYYTVTAVSSGGGETTISNEVGLSVTSLTTPSAPTATTTAGGLQSGTHSYRISAFSEHGETLAGTALDVTVSDDSAVELSWASVSGAVAYGVYVKRDGDAAYGFLIKTASTFSVDWGSSVDYTKSPLATASDTGIKIMWTYVSGAVAYRVYGRTISGDPTVKTRLAEVPSTFNYWVDRGSASLIPVEPVANTTNSGVLIKWDAVLNATGYRIWGRSDSSWGLLTSVGLITSHVDDGSASITIATQPPSSNTTTVWEWQMVDGTLLYRGTVSSATTTTVQIGSPLLGNENGDGYDLGFLQILTGASAGQVRHIRLIPGSTDTFEILDRPFAIAPVATDACTIWAGPGCCGGTCNQTVAPAASYPQPDEVVTTAPPYSWLGVHFSGVLLGDALFTENQRNDINFNWNSIQAPDLIKTGYFDQVWCNERGVPDHNVPLNNPLTTPHGNRLPIGEYSRIVNSIPNAVTFTLDSIAVAPGVRLVVWREPNFTGDILLDVTGPIYIVNWVWRSDSRFSFSNDQEAWSLNGGVIVPQTRRFWSDQILGGSEFIGPVKDMQLWRSGSCRILKTW